MLHFHITFAWWKQIFRQHQTCQYDGNFLLGNGNYFVKSVKNGEGDIFRIQSINIEAVVLAKKWTLTQLNTLILSKL